MCMIEANAKWAPQEREHRGKRVERTGHRDRSQAMI